jgi:hypothetical protein
MQLRPDIQIQSILKAMTDVVLPALDPANPLAQEQARLCMGLLSVMAGQLPLQYRYDCDELARLLSLAKCLQQLPEVAQLAPQALRALTQRTQSGDDVRARARAEPDEVLQAVRALREATGNMVQEAFGNDPPGHKTVELQRAVMAASQAQLLRERSWLLGQGWEAEPAAIPAIETLLAPVCTTV